MTKLMRVLIGYDGSPGARAMLEDLRWAGLPDFVEAKTVSVAETWFPLPTSLGGVETGFAGEALTGVDEARRLAREAQDHLEGIFPGWRIDYAAASGSASGILLGEAEKWPADLVVVGADGQTGLGRFLLGNVAQKISTEAHCQVRVCRGGRRAGSGGVRLIVGIDGSPAAQAAARSVIRRDWPAGSEVRLVNARWDLPAPREESADHETLQMQILEWVAAENARIAGMMAEDRRLIEERGLAVSTIVRKGDPKRLLIEVAEEWQADAIFLGAHGQGRLERMLLGSVSTAIVQRAPCSVEIVR